MLFHAATLDRIRTGEITLAFRHWQRPTVKSGGRLRTAVGELAIESVEPCAPENLTEADATAAGYASLAELLTALEERGGSQLYRIAFRFDRADPRIALRDANQLSEGDRAAIIARLDRFDRGVDGAWTRPILQHIAAHEGRSAATIAATCGIDKPRLKQNIRKLKELGLTESLDTGYRLSPRGKALLEALSR